MTEDWFPERSAYSAVTWTVMLSQYVAKWSHSYDKRYVAEKCKKIVFDAT